MKRAVLVNEGEDAIDELLALEIPDLAECQIAPEVVLAVGVAARAMERALPRDLDRHRGCHTRQDAAPGGDECSDRRHGSTIAGDRVS
jgi:hypothetical protein